MIVKLQPAHTSEQLQAIQQLAEQQGLQTRVEQGAKLTVVCIIGTFNGRYDAIMTRFQQMDGVDSVLQVSEPYKLASRMDHREDTIVRVGNNVSIGDGTLTLIAGPCSVESRDQIFSIARDVHSAGAHILRGGAFKPRTSPYAFQGLGEDGLKMLRDAGGEYGMPVVTEVMDTRQVELVQQYADMLQIGARNMQNFDLLREVGNTNKPVLLKRGMSARVSDLLMSAEYILSQGNNRVVVCERGVTTFDPGTTRNMMDVAAIPVLKGKTHLPIAADPSHATGKPKLIPPMANASIAAGADAVHIEVHNDPKNALSDGDQALRPEEYAQAVEQMRKVAEAMGRRIP